MAELFSVAAKPRLPSAARVRMLARRAWNVPQSDADAISRYFPWPGSHTSMSCVTCAEKPMSPAASVSTR